MKRHHVVVVGGGLIGLSTAYALLRDSHRVTIIEQDHLGSGAAVGNAGEVTPQQVAPLASPSMVGEIARGVFTRTSYLSIAAAQLPRLAGFGIGFLRSTRRSRAERGAWALAQFSAEILPSLHRMAADGIDISGGGDGYLMTCNDDAALKTEHLEYQRRADRGWGVTPGPILRGDALIEHEPALSQETAAGFTLPGEFSLDPVTFVASLADHVQRAGAEVQTRLTAERIGAGASVICSDQHGATVTVAADRVVVAAGAWSTPILRRSGIRSARVVSGKGYSYSVAVKQMPHTPIYSIDRRCVAVPMHGRLRIAGIMDFDGGPQHFNRDRIDVLARAASGLIADADQRQRTDEWVGPRPMTADGLPLLGTVPARPEVIVATGHNMHGLSLGPVTGEVVAALVAERPFEIGGTALDLQPFAVRR